MRYRPSYLLLTMLPWDIAVFGILAPVFSTPARCTQQLHRVNVGNNGFRFDPNTTFANPGGVVTFVFYPTNHSVNRAPESTEAYGNPCVP
jgi:plastocyanin